MNSFNLGGSQIGQILNCSNLTQIWFDSKVQEECSARHLLVGSFIIKLLRIKNKF